MKAAAVFTYTRPWAGREAKAMEAFTDSLTFWGKKAADDVCDEPLAYLGPSGQGMMMIHGDREKLFEILNSDEFRMLYSKVTFAVPDVSYELFAFGEAVQEMMGTWAAVGSELGYM